MKPLISINGVELIYFDNINKTKLELIYTIYQTT